MLCRLRGGLTGTSSDARRGGSAISAIAWFNMTTDIPASDITTGLYIYVHIYVSIYTKYIYNMCTSDDSTHTVNDSTHTVRPHDSFVTKVSSRRILLCPGLVCVRGSKKRQSTITNMEGGVLQPLLMFLATDWPFPEVSRLTEVSRSWRTTVLESLKTATQLILRGRYAECVTDRDARLALVRVTSENLKRIDLSGCHNISAGGMEDILQYIAETCSGVEEVDVTACSNETVLRAVATRARAALGAPLAMDLFALLRSMGDEGERYSFSNLSSLLKASPPLLLFDPALAPCKNSLFQAAAHGTGSDMAMLLSLSFAGISSFDVNEEDAHGNSPLLLACRSGNFEIAEILVVASAGVSAANKRGDTPLLAAVGAGKLELAQMLVSKGANVEAVVRLDLSGHLIGAAGTESLVRVLGQCAALTHLDLFNNGIEAGGAESLAEVLAQCPVLARLNLCGNQIDDAGAASLAGVLGQCTALAHLDLCGNEIGTAGAYSLAGVLAQCPALAHLNLRYNQIGSDALERLRASWCGQQSGLLL